MSSNPNWNAQQSRTKPDYPMAKKPTKKKSKKRK